MLVLYQATALSAAYLLAVSMCVQPLAIIARIRGGGSSSVPPPSLHSYIERGGAKSTTNYPLPVMMRWRSRVSSCPSLTRELFEANKLADDVEFRRLVAEKVGTGFKVPACEAIARRPKRPRKSDHRTIAVSAQASLPARRVGTRPRTREGPEGMRRRLDEPRVDRQLGYGTRSKVPEVDGKT
jgi:hypothetical protein